MSEKATSQSNEVKKIKASLSLDILTFVAIFSHLLRRLTLTNHQDTQCPHTISTDNGNLVPTTYVNLCDCEDEEFPCP